MEDDSKREKGKPSGCQTLLPFTLIDILSQILSFKPILSFSKAHPEPSSWKKEAARLGKRLGDALNPTNTGTTATKGFYPNVEEMVNNNDFVAGLKTQELKIDHQIMQGILAELKQVLTPPITDEKIRESILIVENCLKLDTRAALDLYPPKE